MGDCCVGLGATSLTSTTPLSRDGRGATTNGTRTISYVNAAANGCTASAKDGDPNMKNKIVIIDEAQNFTVPELKKTLTRLHDSCKAIVVGHTGQIDITGKSGFARYIEHFRGQERAQVCELLINHRGWLSSYADQLQED